MHPILPRMDAMLRGRVFKKLMDHRCGSVCAKYGLKQIEAEVLYYMYKKSGSTTSTDICRNLMINKGQISQTMDSLCRKGYLISNADAADRRVILFQLAGQAQEVVTEVDRVREQLMHDTLSGISEEEFAQFRKTALKIFDNVTALMDAEL